MWDHSGLSTFRCGHSIKAIIQCSVSMAATCAVWSKSASFQLLTVAAVLAFPPFMKNNRKTFPIVCWTDGSPSCFQDHSAFIFNLFAITRKIYAENIRNNDVLFSRSQMHNYIKKVSKQNTLSLYYAGSSVCVCVCRVWADVCLDKLCCACRTYRGERWIERGRDERERICRTSISGHEWGRN